MALRSAGSARCCDAFAELLGLVLMRSAPERLFQVEPFSPPCSRTRVNVNFWNYLYSCSYYWETHTRAHTHTNAHTQNSHIYLLDSSILLCLLFLYFFLLFFSFRLWDGRILEGLWYLKINGGSWQVFLV